MRILPYSSALLPQIIAIEEASFSSPWSHESLRQSGESAFSIFLVAIDGDEVLGYGCILVVENEGELINIAVSPDCRCKGVGQALMDALMDSAVQKGAENVYLEVRQSNMPARRLYEKNGFAQIGIRKKYYKNPVEDAILMRCCLSPDRK